MDAGDLVFEFGEILEDTVLPEGWLVFALDIGEIEVTTPEGRKFRMTGVMIGADEEGGE